MHATEIKILSSVTKKITMLMYTVCFTWYCLQVADFGLSKEEVFDGSKSGLKGTYGYMDPDYITTNKFTKKSDVYSFGIILFELITAINPQQGLMEYIDLVSDFSILTVDYSLVHPTRNNI
jgi:serine/threonine protein kinase